MMPHVWATCSWICTGTPISTAVEDLAGQFVALHMAPLNIASCFTAVVKWPFNGRMTGERGTGNLLDLLYILKSTMIRHTKLQVCAGQCIGLLGLRVQNPTLSSFSRAIVLWPKGFLLYVMKALHFRVLMKLNTMICKGLESGSGLIQVTPARLTGAGRRGGAEPSAQDPAGRAR